MMHSDWVGKSERNRWNSLSVIGTSSSRKYVQVEREDINFNLISGLFFLLSREKHQSMEILRLEWEKKEMEKKV